MDAYPSEELLNEAYRVAIDILFHSDRDAAMRSYEKTRKLFAAILNGGAFADFIRGLRDLAVWRAEVAERESGHPDRSRVDNFRGMCHQAAARLSPELSEEAAGGPENMAADALPDDLPAAPLKCRRELEMSVEDLVGYEHVADCAFELLCDWGEDGDLGKARAIADFAECGPKMHLWTLGAYVGYHRDLVACRARMEGCDELGVWDIFAVHLDPFLLTDYSEEERNELDLCRVAIQSDPEAVKYFKTLHPDESLEAYAMKPEVAAREFRLSVDFDSLPDMLAWLAEQAGDRGWAAFNALAVDPDVAPLLSDPALCDAARVCARLLDSSWLSGDWRMEAARKIHGAVMAELDARMAKAA